eukprot:1378857-Rhodomonas_salina.1
MDLVPGQEQAINDDASLYRAGMTALPRDVVFTFLKRFTTAQPEGVPSVALTRKQNHSKQKALDLHWNVAVLGIPARLPPGLGMKKECTEKAVAWSTFTGYAYRNMRVPGSSACSSGIRVPGNLVPCGPGMLKPPKFNQKGPKS